MSAHASTSETALGKTTSVEEFAALLSESPDLTSSVVEAELNAAWLADLHDAVAMSVHRGAPTELRCGEGEGQQAGEQDSSEYFHDDVGGLNTSEATNTKQTGLALNSWTDWEVVVESSHQSGLVGTSLGGQEWVESLDWSPLEAERSPLGSGRPQGLALYRAGRGRTVLDRLVLLGLHWGSLGMSSMSSMSSMLSMMGPVCCMLSMVSAMSGLCRMFGMLLAVLAVSAQASYYQGGMVGGFSPFMGLAGLGGLGGFGGGFGYSPFMSGMGYSGMHSGFGLAGLGSPFMGMSYGGLHGAPIGLGAGLMWG